LEYNTGNIKEAEALFERSYRMINNINTNKTQVYRWLAKVHKFKGNYEDEIGMLEKLLPAGSGRGAIRKNATLSIGRLGKSYLNAGYPEKALHHCEEYVSDAQKYGIAQKVAKHGIEAYVGLNQVEDAKEWAEKWSRELDDGSVEAFYLSCVNKPFSATRTRVKNKLLRAADRGGGDEPILWLGSNDLAEAGKVPQEVLLIKKATHQSFKVGLPEEGLDLLLEGAAKSIEVDEPRLLASFLSYISEYFESLPKSEKINRLYNESANLFPDNTAILAQRGHWRLKRRDEHKAKDLLLRAYEKSHEDGEGDHVYEQNLAVAQGECGNHDGARDRFSSVLDKVTDSFHPDDIAIAYREALKWAVSSEEFTLALEWADDFLGHAGIGIHTHYKAPPIYQYAARAALARNENRRAMRYYRWFRTALAHHFNRTQKGITNFSIRRHADANYEGSLIAYLTGDEERGHAWLVQAQQFATDSDLQPAVEAVEASIAGIHQEAVKLLLDRFNEGDDTSESNDEDWILKTAGRYVIQRAENSSADADLIRELQYKVEVASSTFSEETVLQRELDEKVTSLQEAEDAAEEAKRRSEALKGAFERLIKDLPLPSVAQKARKDLVEAIHDDDEIWAPVTNFVDTLDDSLQKLNIESDGFYEEKIGKGVWGRLDSGIKRRLISAAGYTKLAHESGYDFGPAILALSSGLERLFDLTLIKPLYQEIKYQPSPDSLLRESPASDFDRITLGQVPFVLGLKNNLEGQRHENYRKVLDRWLRREFSKKTISYINTKLNTDITTIRPVRNDWAHGSITVDQNDYAKCERQLIEKDKNPFSVFA
jgi:tetratricopeptide (TPR) repeat protein